MALNLALTASVQGQLLLDAQDAIVQLSLHSMDSDNIQIRDGLWDTNEADKLPRIHIAASGQQVDPNAGTNEGDIVRYGIAVALISATGLGSSTTTSPTHFVWYERIRRRFLNRRGWSNLPSDYDHQRTAVVPPSQMFIEEAKRSGFKAQYLILRCEVKETRQLVAAI